MKRTLAVIALATAIASPARAQTSSSTTAAPLTTEVRPETAPGLDLPTLVLRLPQAFLELAFVPLMPVAVLFERYHVIDRLFDLFTNDAKTLAVVPIVVPFNASGIGVGATLVYNEPLGSADRLIAVVLVRENRDRNISVSFGRRLATLNGRAFSLGASYASDHDQRIYGFGAGTQESDERLIRVDGVDATASFQLIAPARVPEYSAGVGAAFRRRRIGVGSGDRAPGLAPNDSVAVPPGFGRTLDYPEFSIESAYDSRDSVGRTTKGIIASLQSSVTHDMNGGSTGGVRIEGGFSAFLPLLPLYRVLYLSVGAAGTVPIGEENEVPLHQMVSLGGSGSLRGYPSDRFLGRMGWWATAEWRYRFYEYEDSTIGLSAVWFGDLGQVSNDVDGFGDGLPWSVGFALRAEQNLINLGRAQIAYGPEGFRFSVGVGEVF
ncbi:MAG: BamA/TamA family outer membrane protein [Deltaproteobacteria bacterium]